MENRFPEPKNQKKKFPGIPPRSRNYDDFTNEYGNIGCKMLDSIQSEKCRFDRNCGMSQRVASTNLKKMAQTEKKTTSIFFFWFEL